MPYIPDLDLAACFYYAFDEAGVENGMIPSTDPICQLECDGQGSACLRCENTPRLFPWVRLCRWRSALETLLEELQAEVRQHLAREIPMMILTNAGKTYGALLHFIPESAGAAG